jgi:hypothetical protein
VPRAAVADAALPRALVGAGPTPDDAHALLESHRYEYRSLDGGNLAPRKG